MESIVIKFSNYDPIPKGNKKKRMINFGCSKNKTKTLMGRAHLLNS